MSSLRVVALVLVYDVTSQTSFHNIRVSSLIIAITGVVCFLDLYAHYTFTRAVMYVSVLVGVSRIFNV